MHCSATVQAKRYKIVGLPGEVIPRILVHITYCPEDEPDPGGQRVAAQELYWEKYEKPSYNKLNRVNTLSRETKGACVLVVNRVHAVIQCGVLRQVGHNTCVDEFQGHPSSSPPSFKKEDLPGDTVNATHSIRNRTKEERQDSADQARPNSGQFWEAPRPFWRPGTVVSSQQLE